MRDPQRIDPILALVGRIWRAHPDLRLAQVIGNCTSGDAYHMEDAELFARLHTVYEVEEGDNETTEQHDAVRGGQR